MDKKYQKIRQQAGLLGAIGGMLVGLPAIAMPRIEAELLLSQTNPNPSIFNEPPYNRGSSTSPLNPRPGIFNEPPYNRRPGSSPSNPGAVPSSPATPDGLTPPTPDQEPSPGTLPSTPPAPGSVLQPPLPEQRQSPSATVMPINGKVSIRLVNQTGANITYQVIGDTNQRSLQGKSNVNLLDLSAPVTLAFKRNDGGLLMVSPQASSQPGMLEVTFTETTDLTTDRTTMTVQKTGAVFLN